jgi:hypothetical protein
MVELRSDQSDPFSSVVKSGMQLNQLSNSAASPLNQRSLPLSQLFCNAGVSGAPLRQHPCIRFVSYFYVQLRALSKCVPLSLPFKERSSKVLAVWNDCQTYFQSKLYWKILYFQLDFKYMYIHSIYIVKDYTLFFSLHLKTRGRTTFKPY